MGTVGAFEASEAPRAQGEIIKPKHIQGQKDFEYGFRIMKIGPVVCKIYPGQI